MPTQGFLSRCDYVDNDNRDGVTRDDGDDSERECPRERCHHPLARDDPDGGSRYTNQIIGKKRTRNGNTSPRSGRTESGTTVTPPELVPAQ